LVGGADASQNGLGDLMPAKLTDKSGHGFSFDQKKLSPEAFLPWS
jgi:hypothetical protein